MFDKSGIGDNIEWILQGLIIPPTQKTAELLMSSSFA